MMLGNGLWETAQLNERFQLTQIGLGTAPTDKSLFKVDYEYGELSQDGLSVDSVKNVGNIARQTTTIPTTSFTQTYRYDANDRLTEARETTNGTQNWKQTFGYDRFGNRTNFSQTVGSTQLQLNAITHPTIDQTTNRFTTGQGYVYDYNGNLIQDAEGRTFTFNGDDKQIQVKDVNQQTIGTYLYDGDGARVKKVTSAETTVFVYDAGGKLAAEYSTATPPPTPQTNYLTSDHLGSPRVITDKQGQVTARRDFMPFGEELGAGVGTRTEALKYSFAGTDNIRKRFTGYEKDDETQLDFAEARMYQNKHGRFTAVDPLMASASLENPQTFNRYTYTGNNPVNYTDPSGLKWCQKNGSNDTIFTGEGKDCGEGYTAVDGRQGNVVENDLCGTNGCFGPGSVVIPEADGSITLVSSPSQEDADNYAAKVGVQVQMGAEEVAVSSSTDLGLISVSSRPLPSDMLPLCATGETCRPYTPPVTALDTANNPPLKTVALIEAIAEVGSAAPAVGIPFTIIDTIIDIGQGDWEEAAGNLPGIIPGVKIGKIGRRTQGMTEPTLPKGTIAQQGDVKIASHYKGTGEHAPPHVEVTSDGGRGKTRIGAMGGEIEGSRPLTRKEQSVVNANKSKIRTAVNKIRNYIRYKKLQKMDWDDK